MSWTNQKRRARAGPLRLGALVLVGVYVALAAGPAQALTVSATLSAGGQSMDYPTSECYSFDSDFFKITNTSDTLGVELTAMSLTLHCNAASYYFDPTPVAPGCGCCQDYTPRVAAPSNPVTDETCSVADGSDLLTLTFAGATLGKDEQHWFGVDIDEEPHGYELIRGQDIQHSIVTFTWTYGGEEYTGTGCLVLCDMTGSDDEPWPWSLAEVVGAIGGNGDDVVIPEPATVLLLGGALIGGLGAYRRRRQRVGARTV